MQPSDPDGEATISVVQSWSLPNFAIKSAVVICMQETVGEIIFANKCKQRNFLWINDGRVAHSLV